MPNEIRNMDRTIREAACFRWLAANAHWCRMDAVLDDYWLRRFDGDVWEGIRSHSDPVLLIEEQMAAEVEEGKRAAT